MHNDAAKKSICGAKRKAEFTDKVGKERPLYQAQHFANRCVI